MSFSVIVERESLVLSLTDPRECCETICMLQSKLFAESCNCKLLSLNTELKSSCNISLFNTGFLGTITIAFLHSCRWYSSEIGTKLFVIVERESSVLSLTDPRECCKTLCMLQSNLLAESGNCKL